ncbi:putative bifunctional diguanylate cyclase/phosphodiesterase [Colwellia sp. C1TZA3]|uniref:putative bifunctional diguanylate cyclase/phosphodiesterase n=1 Tax=Colwellia sp. C1TZA3 TaxID=2508879 RepID=UPI0011BA14FF|nr:EAL domain-containing protein [Colwellia sp. C1TZA3]TWX65744.1 EAL domain-containing protein [Colwellia sp. C1TZA3]
MNAFIDSKLISTILIASIALLSAYFLGLMRTEYNLLDPVNYKQLKLLTIGNVSGYIETSEKKVHSSCIMPGSKDVDFCGSLIVLSNNATKGADFSRYDQLEVDLSLNSPLEKPAIKVTFRNYAKRYAPKNKADAINYTSMVTNNLGNGPKTYPLNYFQVASWWILRNAISIEDAQPDLSNIVHVEILHFETQTEGTYEITINTLKLTGNLLSLTEILMINSCLWIAAIFLLIRRHSRNLNKIATIDTLTKLVNRRGMQQWIDALKIGENKPKVIGLLYIDIDDFKQTNDTFGHKTGDELLTAFCVHVSACLKSLRRAKNSYIFSRMSGDEFVVLFKDLNDLEAKATVQMVLDSLALPLQLKEVKIKVNISVGIAIKTIVSNSVDQLFDCADSAMYKAKKGGKNQFCLYSDEQQNDVMEYKQNTQALRLALEHDQFDLKFMPIFEVSTKKVRNVEVLVRSDHELLDKISTSELIKIAERAMLVQDLDTWVLRNTFIMLNENRNLLEKWGLKFCINVSTLDFQEQNFCDTVRHLLTQYNIPPKWIELEITETALATDISKNLTVMNQIKEMGISIALDDFGTGYTALNHLVRYPVDKIKIDKIFIDALGHEDEDSKVLIEAILSIARSYQLEVSAVGVETSDQYDYLIENGCHFIQGYLYSKPLGLSELSKRLCNQGGFFEEL